MRERTNAWGAWAGRPGTTSHAALRHGAYIYMTVTSVSSTRSSQFPNVNLLKENNKPKLLGLYVKT